MTAMRLIRAHKVWTTVAITALVIVALWIWLGWQTHIGQA